ncbi:hypothetical protein WJX72_011126 [[Myrmecia] bisecta]|uniref:RNA helicase n=1 Tax=[Myrmecia] bisecta TaxID=41462 RepID=A0AAW1PH48_9CHLO
MGGVKNREEKKKAAKVFSSGAGGGSKGPGLVDKRDQERPCPHCDRTFKQVQRLKEHIAKKHPPEDEGGDDAASVAGSSAAAEGPSNVAQQAAPPGGKMFDVGSRAGFYTERSPKMILMEHCTKQKLGKPRFQARPDKHGTIGCRVVIPNLKDNTKDIVVFLEESQAAATEEEAQQRGAVAMLHRIAGERALHRVLPPAYRPLWDEMAVLAEERAKRDAKRAAAAEERAQRERAHRAADARRKPARVVMSDHQRTMVESVLRDLRLGGGAAAEEWDSSNNDGQADEVMAKLLSLGFGEEAVREALACTSQEGEVSVEAALDWLCLSLPEEALPASFAHGATHKPVQLRSGNRAQEQQGDAMRPQDDPAVAELLSYGYPLASCSEALQQCRGKVFWALHALYSRLTGVELREVEPSAELDTHVTEEWLEERVALDAIYGKDVHFESPFSTRLRLPVPQGTLELQVLLPPGCRYPVEAPDIAVRCPQLAPGQLLQLTSLLAKDAAELASNSMPMVYELAAAAVSHQQRRPQNRRPQINVEAESRRLAEEQQQVERNPRHARMRETRRKLPAYGQRIDVLGALHDHQVVVVSGATGCGKSTQVPQYILEEAVAAGQGGHCNIICTQPRRISAVGLASRVAQERGERVGDVVGYSVRLDSKTSARTRLLFCTTGVLLRRLLGDPDLGDVSHVIVDEVHERSVDSDLLLMLLRDLLARNTGRQLRVVLMSATADAQLFAQYFRAALLTKRHGPPPAAVLTIPGFTHPVRDLFLEDVLERTGFAVGRSSRYAQKGRPNSGAKASGNATDGATRDRLGKTVAPSASGSAAPKLVAHTGGSRSQPDLRVLESWEDAAANLANPEAPSASTATLRAVQDTTAQGRAPSAQRPRQQQLQPGRAGRASGPRHSSSADDLPAAAEVEYGERTLKALENIDEAQLNYELIEALVCHIVAEERVKGLTALLQGVAAGDLPGAAAAANAILIFMPGAPEINRLVRTLQNSGRLQQAAQGQTLRVLPLHGALPSAHQARVFESVPEGVRKIVVATNVAETSITIDDVVCVIDSGRVKEMRYDASRGISRLQETWVSLAAGQQRRGRAGRVRPGVCFRLFSRAQAARMEPQQAPEVMRVPLEALCLTVKAALGSSMQLQTTLGRLLTPPEDTAVAAAVAALHALGALDAGEALTPLGQLLTRMPMDCRLGKALLFGAMLRCLGPVLTIAAAMAYGRPIWQSPPDKRAEAEAAKRSLTGDGAAAKSDHLALVAAFNTWHRALLKGGRREASAVCSQYFISEAAMEATLAGRAEYAAILADLGFMAADYARTLGREPFQIKENSRMEVDLDPEERGLNDYAGNARIVKAALCAGLYPSILRVEHPAEKFRKVEGGAFVMDNNPAALRFFDRTKGRVFLHPASVNFHCGRFESGWLVYSDMVETAKVYVRESSMVPVYALLLFGGEISVQHEVGLLQVDGWATFSAPARIAVLVKELRDEIDRLLLQKLSEPSFDLAHNRVVDALHQLLATDGF